MSSTAKVSGAFAAAAFLFLLQAVVAAYQARVTADLTGGLHEVLAAARVR
jgi:hypothetical protein